MKLSNLLIILFLTGCATPHEPLRVHQEHLDAWTGMPIEALETHTWFLTRPRVKSKTSGGTEIWHYYDGYAATKCNSHGNVSVNNSLFLPSAQYRSWASCADMKVGCNSIFFVKNNIITKYQVTGSCYTSKILLPQHR